MKTKRRIANELVFKMQSKTWKGKKENGVIWRASAYLLIPPGWFIWIPPQMRTSQANYLVSSAFHVSVCRRPFGPLIYNFNPENVKERRRYFQRNCQSFQVTHYRCGFDSQPIWTPPSTQFSLIFAMKLHKEHDKCHANQHQTSSLMRSLHLAWYGYSS